jgi:hypothetical protein
MSPRSKRRGRHGRKDKPSLNALPPGFKLVLFVNNQSAIRSRPIPRSPVTKSGAVDPFATACVPLNQDLLMLLRYYKEVCHPNVWKTEHCLGASSDTYHFQYTIQSILTDCLHYSVNMFSLAASMASQSVTMHNIKLERPIAYFYDKALVAARASVSQATTFTESMIFNMFHLACTEFYRCNMSEALIHLRVIERAVTRQGGMTTLSVALRELLILGDGYAAAELDAAPYLKVSDLDKSHVVPASLAKPYDDIAERMSLGSIPTSSAFRHYNLPTELAQTIKDLAICIELLKYLSENQSRGERDYSGLHWIHVYGLLIRHRLLGMRFSNPRTDAIRTALIAWGLFVLCGAGRNRVAKNMAKSFQVKMSLIPDHVWTGFERVRCWILLVFVQCSARYSAAQEWYVGELKQLYRHLVTRSDSDHMDVDMLAAFCRDFFFLDRVERTSLTGVVVPLLNAQ